MFINPSQTAPILVMAASTRSGSINSALAQRIATHLGEHAELVDLRDHRMPLYDGDLEALDGVPDSARALASRLAAAQTAIIVTPEYNGAFTPLLKNTIDWVTRVNAAALSHLRVLVATASPGRGGGSNAAAITRLWLASMGIDVAEHPLCIGQVALGEDGDIDGIDDDELERFVSQAARSASAA